MVDGMDWMGMGTGLMKISNRQFPLPRIMDTTSFELAYLPTPTTDRTSWISYWTDSAAFLEVRPFKSANLSTLALG